MLFMKKVSAILRKFGEDELEKIGVSKETLCTLVYEGINNIPFTQVIDGKEADEVFTLKKGKEYTYCVIANFIGLVFESSNEIVIEELPVEILDGCTAYEVLQALQGSPEAPFSLKERLEACAQQHAYA